MDATQSDHIGMLGTVMNALALQDALERHGQPTRVQSAIEMPRIAEPYIRRRAVRHLEKGRVVIFAAGTGNPFFTTDTAAALRAAEIDAEALLKGTHSGVDGVYDADPRTTDGATKYAEVGYMEVMTKDLRVMDATAIAFCRDNQIPIVVFDMTAPGSLRKILEGERVGTIVRRRLSRSFARKQVARCTSRARRLRFASAAHPAPAVRASRRAVGIVLGSGWAEYAGRVIEETLLDADDKMSKAVEHTQSQFGTVRTGRAAPALVERITVEYYGSPVPLQQLAAIQVPEARQLLVKPHDRSTLGDIEKAIRDSDLGVNPSNDGTVIRLSFPPLTEERRKEYVKVVRHMAEDGRVAIRNLRRDARKHLEAWEKDGDMSADDLERAEKELEKITHRHTEAIDGALGRKESELLEV